MKDDSYYYLLRIQESLNLAALNILWFYNGFISEIFKYIRRDYYHRKRVFSIMAEPKIEKNFVLTEEFKKAFQFFYKQVENYYDKRDIDVCGKKNIKLAVLLAAGIITAIAVSRIRR